jgi:glycosyltransferase involved in cell wall biosynthesis
VAVVPSLYEGFSLPAIEAMACGVPLVATTGGALPEVVGTSGDTGLLVPPDDPEALAGALRTVLDDPDLARRLGEGGRRRVLGRFTWEATARGTAGQYRERLGSTRARHAAAPGVADVDGGDLVDPVAADLVDGTAGAGRAREAQC